MTSGFLGEVGGLISSTTDDNYNFYSYLVKYWKTYTGKENKRTIGTETKTLIIRLFIGLYFVNTSYYFKDINIALK